MGNYRVITLPDPLHAFLEEVLTRVVREGLLVPDELPYAAGLWERVRGAQAVATPEAKSGDTPRGIPEKELECML